jgi:hypothetical protein
MHDRTRTYCPILILSLMIFLFLSTLPGLCETRSQANSTEHVVLVIIDGLRYSEGMGDPNHTYTPNMWRLAQQGAIIEPFYNDGITYTSRAIPAIWCGAWTDVHNFADPDCDGQGNNYTELPTIFEYYRKGLRQPAGDCIYVLKDVGCPWKASLDADYGPDFWPLYHSVGRTDLDVWDEAKKLLNTFSPSLSLIYLAEVDHAGHSGNWDYYTESIAIADSIVGLVWDYFQAQPNYAGKTTMFVTNDHGRHSTDFTGHGDACNGCRQIQLLAVGPDIQQGTISNIPRTLCDITPTVGELLGFTTEKATGSAMMELLSKTNVKVEDRHIAADILKVNAVPNPFNPSTEFRFNLAQNNDVQISVYNASGKLVATPFQGRLASGEHRVRWDALSQTGNVLPSGVYLVTIRAENKSTNQRILLLR